MHITGRSMSKGPQKQRGIACPSKRIEFSSMWCEKGEAVLRHTLVLHLPLQSVVPLSLIHI